MDRLGAALSLWNVTIGELGKEKRSWFEYLEKNHGTIDDVERAELCPMIGAPSLPKYNSIMVC